MFEASFQYKTAMVTGASSGLGAALAEALALKGVERIVLVARRESALRIVADKLSCATDIVVADLTTPQGLQAAQDCMDGIELLINNAGFASFGPFVSQNTTTEAKMVELNCMAPVKLTGRLLPSLVAQNHGCVVNIASGMAFTPMPYMSTYAATKAFLLRWSEGIAGELAQTDVRFITICPGTFPSEFADTSGVPVDDIPGSSLVTCSVQSVVDATMKAITSPRAVIVPGFANRFASITNAFVPRAVLRWILARLMGRSARRLSG